MWYTLLFWIKLARTSKEPQIFSQHFCFWNYNPDTCGFEYNSFWKNEFPPFYATSLKSFLSIFCFFLPAGNKADHICKCCCGQRQFWSYNLPRSWHCINLCTHCHHGWGLCSSWFRLSPFSTTYSTSWSKHIIKWAAAVCISSHFWMFWKKILDLWFLGSFGNLWNRLHEAAADFIIFKLKVRSFTIGHRCKEGKALCSCDSSFSSFWWKTLSFNILCTCEKMIPVSPAFDERP